MKAYTKRDATKSSEDPFRYIAFASDLQIPVGQVPRFIETDVGNFRDFVLARVDKEGTAFYFQDLGATSLVVYND